MKITMALEMKMITETKDKNGKLYFYLLETLQSIK